MVEQDGHGVREDFPKQPAHQVPKITRPYPLYGVASHQLRKNCVYPVAKTAQQSTPLGSRISLFGGVWSEQLDPHARQVLCGLGRVVVLRSPMRRPEVPSAISGTTESSWELAGATEKRVISPGQQSLTCILKP